MPRLLTHHAYPSVGAGGEASVPKAEGANLRIIKIGDWEREGDYGLFLTPRLKFDWKDTKGKEQKRIDFGTIKTKDGSMKEENTRTSRGCFKNYDDTHLLTEICNLPFQPPNRESPGPAKKLKGWIQTRKAESGLVEITDKELVSRMPELDTVRLCLPHLSRTRTCDSHKCSPPTAGSAREDRVQTQTNN